MATVLPASSPNYINETSFERVEPKLASALHLRSFDGYVATTAGTGTINLVKLPPGRVRIFPDLSRLVTSAITATGTISIGYAAYTKENGTAVNALTTAFVNAGAAGAGALDSAFVLPAVGYLDLDSKDGIVLTATVATADMRIGDTIDGWVAYTNVN